MNNAAEEQACRTEPAALDFPRNLARELRGINNARSRNAMHQH